MTCLMFVIDFLFFTISQYPGKDKTLDSWFWRFSRQAFLTWKIDVAQSFLSVAWVMN